jgi:hypothetical protein
VLLSDFIDQNKNALASSFVSSASLVSNYIWLNSDICEQ